MSQCLGTYSEWHTNKKPLNEGLLFGSYESRFSWMTAPMRQAIKITATKNQKKLSNQKATFIKASTAMAAITQNRPIKPLITCLIDHLLVEVSERVVFSVCWFSKASLTGFNYLGYRSVCLSKQLVTFRCSQSSFCKRIDFFSYSSIFGFWQ